MTVTSTLDELPCCVVVSELIAGRYKGMEGSLQRPLSWDERQSGNDIILTEDGMQLKLLSTGQQSSPVPGWKLLITGGSSDSGYTWTLYGMPATDIARSTAAH
jgi:hypothetical protein